MSASVAITPAPATIEWRAEFKPSPDTPESWLYCEYSEKHPQIREIATFLKALFGHYPEDCGFIELRCFQKRGTRIGSGCYRRWYPLSCLTNLVRRGDCEQNIAGIQNWFDQQKANGNIWKPDVLSKGSPYKQQSLFDISKDIALHAREYDVYVGVLPRRASGEGDALSVRAAGCVWADLDAKNGMTEQLCLSASDGADIVVKSGSPGCLHSYWLSNSILPMDVQTRPRFRQKLLMHQTRIHAADITADLPRILRVAGTWSHKGEESRPVRLLRYPR